QSSRYLTAFSTPSGKHYMFNRIPFGLKVSGAGFMRVMDIILSDLKFNGVIAFVDDFVPYASTFIEHLERLENVLQKFVQHGLTLKLEKCAFATNSIVFLGFAIS